MWLTLVVEVVVEDDVILCVVVEGWIGLLLLVVVVVVETGVVLISSKEGWRS